MTHRDAGGLRAVCWVAFVVASVLGVGHAPAARGEVMVDAGFPGGNVVVERIERERVWVRPDLRDTAGDWFYWCFRVRGAEGRTLTFVFTKSRPVGVRGAAVSVDGMKRWEWLGNEKGSVDSFTYTFGPEAKEVYFGMGMTYTQKQWEAFLEQVGERREVVRGVLCQSKKGRDVEMLRVGKVEGEPRHRVLITARHHACEMMASYVLEGFLEAVLADDGVGRKLRQDVEFMVVPFVDKDGVEEGDQGKNRRPRDHNRDYDGASVHRETAALRQRVPGWGGGKLTAMIDLHCPFIRGQNNEHIYQVGKEEQGAWGEQVRFGKLLEGICRETGSLPYRQAGDVPFGTAWNTRANYAQGMTVGRWGTQVLGAKLVTTFEVPYANASGKVVDAESARGFGRDVARALGAYLGE